MDKQTIKSIKQFKLFGKVIFEKTESTVVYREENAVKIVFIPEDYFNEEFDL